MKIGTFALLLVLLWTAPSGAACAWVLWHLTTFRVDRPDPRWTPLGGATSEAECRRQMADLVKTEVKLSTLVQSYTCLPDLVDPRSTSK